MSKPLERLQRTRIKICGITREEDRDCAIAAGVDSLGLVFCAASPRHLELARAQTLARDIPAFVNVVALFLNPSEAEVRQVLQQVKPDLLQFHGHESAAFCTQFGRRYIKAISMAESASEVLQQIEEHRDACGYVLDSHAPDGIGGTGKKFDWTQIPAEATPLVLAGGLRAENVAQAIQAANPWAVDVSSGVETQPGLKSAVKIENFIRAVRQADVMVQAPTEK